MKYTMMVGMVDPSPEHKVTCAAHVLIQARRLSPTSVELVCHVDIDLDGIQGAEREATPCAILFGSERRGGIVCRGMLRRNQCDAIAAASISATASANEDWITGIELEQQPLKRSSRG